VTQPEKEKYKGLVLACNFHFGVSVGVKPVVDQNTGKGPCTAYLFSNLRRCVPSDKREGNLLQQQQYLKLD
jgi:hypothetical protein